MKTAKKICIILSAVLLIFGLAVAALNVIFNETGWLYKEYLDELSFVKKYYGISAEDAERVLSRMMFYAIGREDELQTTIVEDGEEVPFFIESELSHMDDVRKLTVTVMWAGAVSLAIGLICLAVLMIRRDREGLRLLAKAYLIALGAALVIIIGLAVWIVIDFDSFWTMFHVVFLDLESSTFDPAVSRMIRICPAELFADFIGNLGTYAAILVGAFAVAGAIYLRASKKKNA